MVIAAPRPAEEEMRISFDVGGRNILNITRDASGIVDGESTVGGSFYFTVDLGGHPSVQKAEKLAEYLAERLEGIGDRDIIINAPVTLAAPSGIDHADHIMERRDRDQYTVCHYGDGRVEIGIPDAFGWAKNYADKIDQLLGEIDLQRDLGFKTRGSAIAPERAAARPAGTTRY